MDRKIILKNIKRNKPEATILPQPFYPTEKKGDKCTLFKEMLQQAGGNCVEFGPMEIHDTANVSEVYKTSETARTRVGEIPEASSALDAFLSEHYPGAIDIRKREVFDTHDTTCPKEELERLKTVILEGVFGVAENGATWIDGSSFPNRLIPFITEELVVCLDSKQIVNDMHEAYERVKNMKTGFGLFIAGPSKTSDIEQHLVLGAHGSKKVTIILCY